MSMVPGAAACPTVIPGPISIPVLIPFPSPRRSAPERRPAAALSANRLPDSLGRPLADCWQVVLLAMARFREARCVDAASNLAFTTLIAIVPLLAIGFAIVSVFPVFGEFTEQLRAFATGTLLPEAADRVVSVYISEFAANAARVSAIGVKCTYTTAQTVQTVLHTTGAYPRHQRVFSVCAATHRSLATKQQFSFMAFAYDSTPLYFRSCPHK